MVSKKKRPPPALESIEPLSKKSKSFDGAGTSGGSSVISSSRKQSKKKEPDSVHEIPIKMEEDDDELPVHNNSRGNEDFPHWPEADLIELMKQIENQIPQKDNLRFDSRADKLDWNEICFGDYSSKECRDMWIQIQKRLRRFRLLREVLEDAKTWVTKPWTNFYRGQKQNRHPDLPRRPLSTYMLFYLEKKDKVARENPGLEMTGVSKCIAELYKNLPEKKKQKYIDMAASQRREYEEKMELFYQIHPDLVPKPLALKESRSSTTPEIGPRKPTTPFKLYYTDKVNRHKNDVDFDRNILLERCKEQWRGMADKKKVVWINWALEDETRYQEELKAYMSENPSFVPSNVKAILTKEEKVLKERVAGKPEKPPNSGYSLFSRLMLLSADIKQVAPKERMSQISKLWKCVSDLQKKKYQEQVNHMLDQYKLEYATYLESLPEDKRQEELLNNQPKRRPAKPKLSHVKETKPIKTSKESNKKYKQAVDNKALYKGEPEPPPVNAYQLFLKTFMNNATHILPENREKEAPRYWQMLPDSEKTKHRKKLNEIKGRYIEDYEKFLKSLSQEQLKEYSLQKASLKKEVPDSSEDSDSDGEDSGNSEVDNSSNQQDSGSDDDSSSDSDSDSDDSSDSNESEADDKDNNDSEDSSSSTSDSD